MVDAQRLVSLLARVTDRLRILEEYQAQPRSQLQADRVRMGDLKYTFQTAIEACIDAAHHVIAAEGLSVPATNADTFRQLVAAEVLSPEVGDVMAAAAGFRNVLVHGYADVDNDRVTENLDRLPVLRTFVKQLVALTQDG